MVRPKENRLKITFVTGTRADFSKQLVIAQEFKNAGWQVTFFVTGMHLLHAYGLTKAEVFSNSGFNFFEHPNTTEDKTDLTSVLYETIRGLQTHLNWSKPNFLGFHGDRTEAIASALTATTMNLPTIHIEGGEVSGTVDEAFRHATSKLATAHLVCTETAVNRLIAMGEEPFRIFNIGSPELDLHISDDLPTIREVRRHYEISFEEYGIVIFHPIVTDIGETIKTATTLFAALKKSSRSYVVILPNNDPGSDEIRKIISVLDKEVFRVLPSMRFKYFSTLLQNSKIIVGNSSCGIREAPFLGIPSVNLGTRQKNRKGRTLNNPVELAEFTETELLEKITVMWGRRFSRDFDFGAGESGRTVFKLIQSGVFSKIPIQKTFYDNSI